MPDNSRSPQARAAAVEVLMNCIGQGRPLHNLPDNQAVKNLSIADRAFASEIIYGTLRNLLRCDYLINCHSETSLDRLDPEILWVLRISVYQLDFMSVPDYAIVDDAVRLARFFGKSSASGFVNGILRGFLRNRHPLPTGNSISALSIRYSHPQWLVKRYVNRYGAKASKKIMKRNNQVPDSYIRINSGRINVDDFCRCLEAEGIPFDLYPNLQGCLKIHQRGFNRHRLYLEGFCFYMDYGSQMVAERVGVEPGMKVGDFCAAPGGKSFILSDRTGAAGLVLAADRSRPRLRQMRHRMRHYRIENCSLICADMESSAPPARGLDRILLDVPCSGLGTIRSNPDIRWLFKEEDLLRHKERQLTILQNGFESLEKGKKLFYTSCSTEPEENELVIRDFLQSESGASLEDEPLHTLHDQNEGEGFFVAGLRRI